MSNNDFVGDAPVDSTKPVKAQTEVSASSLKRLEFEKVRRTQYYLTVVFFGIILSLFAVSVAAIVATIGIKEFPISQELVKLIADAPFISLCLVMGSVGSGVKFLTLSADQSIEPNPQEANKSEKRISLLHFLMVGGAMGVFSFLFIKSRVLHSLIYNAEAGETPELSAHGMALVAAAAGYFAFEFLGYAKDRLKMLTGN